MNLLLDTHTTLWWLNGDKRLSSDAASAIRRAPIVYVSAVSAWEVAIKSALGKLTLPAPFEDGVTRSQFTQLPMTFAHATTMRSLTPHHADPFDRMLIAQALSEQLTLVTHDEQFREYGLPVIWT